MNYLNIFLINDRGDRVKTRVETEASPKSELEKPEIVEPSQLRASLPCAMALLGAKSPFNSLGVAKPCKRFF